MLHKRIHIRVPVTGEAMLHCKSGIVLKALTIDISVGGFLITNPSYPLEDVEYQVEITPVDMKTVKFKAALVHEDAKGAGFKIVEIDNNALQSIYNLIADFQSTDEFIKLIDENDILNDWFLDNDGNELDITFEVET